jgi:AcrR family transcriptional regulator
MNDTKERILNQAERLFAEQGYSATSLRSVIAAAGVNLAAVHYHFHSKEALLDAVVMRRVEPMNRERLALLEEYERAAGGEPPTLEAVLTALLAPPVRLTRQPGFAMFAKLMGRLYLEGDVPLVHKYFGAIFKRFMAAIRRILPDLPENEFLWRAYFAQGVMACALRGRPEMVGATGELTVERLVSFISAGLRAPIAAETRSNA